MIYSKDFKKPKILVVEDDTENQKFLEMFLGRFFYVEICDSEDTFRRRINTSDFDIILMDISLRGAKNGLELTRELRLTDKYKKIPIVCLSAHAFKKDKVNAMNAGIDFYLTKPVDNGELLKTLQKALKEKINTSS